MFNTLNAQSDKIRLLDAGAIWQINDPAYPH